MALLLSAHVWFDPMPRYKFPASRCSATKASPRVCYIPGLDGTHTSPFAQWPALAESGFAISVLDPRATPVDESFEVTVDRVIDHLSCNEPSAPTLLMGESYGGVVAAAVALRAPSLLAGLILVNSATAFGHRPQLQADALILAKVPEWLFSAACFVLLGRKTFDLGFVTSALRDVVIERRLQKLKESDPALAGFYTNALEDLTQQLAQLPPRNFMIARVAHLRDGCEFVEPKLASMRPPVLVIAGTADALLDSEAEAKRLQSILGRERCKIHLVEGAARWDADQRIDLRRVLAEWAAEAPGLEQKLPLHGEP